MDPAREGCFFGMFLAHLSDFSERMTIVASTGHSGSSLHRECARELSDGAPGCHQEEKGAAPGIDLRLGPLLQRGVCNH
jgi:hypothetical protein